MVKKPVNPRSGTETNWDILVMDSGGRKLVHDASDSPELMPIGEPVQESKVICALGNPIN